MLSKRRYYQEIRDYYVQSNWLYKYVWYAGKSLGLHFGFADPETTNHTEALINQYRYVVDRAKIKRGMRVLDAGCGVGGGSIYIAKTTGAKVLGITLVPEQVDEAKRNAKKAGVVPNVEFCEGDYCATRLEPNSYDVVFGMESVCYAWPKKAFVQEAFRLLKPGGILVLTDGYRKRAIRGGEEQQVMAEFCKGWKLAGLSSYLEMARAIENGGFIQLKVEDMTKATEMSLSKMRKLVWWWNIGERILGWIDMPIVAMTRANARAMRAWIEGVERGLFGYYAHVAQKPQ